MNHYTNGEFYSTDTLPIIKAADGCSYWRTKLPFTYGGMDLETIKKIDIDELYKEAKVVTFNRSHGFPWEEFMNSKKHYQFKVAFDLRRW